MFVFFVLLWLIATIAMIVYIVKMIREKDKDEKKKNRKKLVICCIVACISVIMFSNAGASTETSGGESEQAEGTTEEIETLKDDLKDKYDISEPDKFLQGDSTGKWRLETVANGTATYKYAVDYAKVYMDEGDVHYIVNFSLKTTSQLRELQGKLSVITTEYVDGEEHDARVIGSGMVYAKQYFDIETGDEVTTEGDINAGTVENGTFLSTVQNIVTEQVGEGEKITAVAFDGENLTVMIDLSNASINKVSPEKFAEIRTSTITDDILALDDSYYNTWTTITIGYENIGTISFDKSDVKDEGFGRYFEVPSGYFE